MASSLPPEAVLLDYTMGFAKGKILYAAIENRLLDVYAREGKALTPHQVAELATTDSDATTRLIRALSGLGVLEEKAEGAHDLTPLGRLLVSDQETGNLSPQAAFILHANEPPCWNACHQLSRTVKEGGNGWEKTAEGKEYGGLFQYYQAHPSSQNAFDTAMTGISARETPAILQAYDGFQDMDVLMDVGGGQGKFLAAITSKYPHLKSINFDLPHVIENAPQTPHVEHASGDVFKTGTLPKASNIVLKHILHDWDDDGCRKILASCYEALPPGGKLLIVDAVIPNHGAAPPEARQFVTMLDVMMMMIVTGRERTEQEWRELLDFKGFDILRIVPTQAGPAIIEAIKV